MFKKSWAFIITIAIVASFCLIPASAETLNDTLIADIDFSSESYENKLDNGKFTDPTESVYGDGTVEFVTDETLGIMVGQFKGRAIQYTVDADTLANDLTDAFTFETYVNIAKTNAFGLVCGTLWYGGDTIPNTGAGICVGLFGDTSTKNYIGTKNCLTAAVGTTGEISNISGTKELSYGQWVHLVYVHDGDTDYFYMNGTDVTNGGAPSYGSLGQKEDVGFRIGGYNLANNFDIKDMRMAFCRVYATAVNADEAKSLYAAVGGEPGGDPSGEQPTEKPAEDPAAGSQATATAKPSGSQSSGSKPAPVSSAKTFDLGLVSLAAVSLSSIVLVKKKRT